MAPADKHQRVEGKSWYRIHALAAGSAGPTRIDLYDEIGFWGISDQEFLADLQKIKGPVELHINSPGGDVFQGANIYNNLMARTGVTTVVDGIAASAAALILLAGEERLGNELSQVMIHDAWAGMDGNAAEMAAMAARLETTSQQMAQALVRTAGGTIDDWRALMRATTYYTADEALEKGILTGVIISSRGQMPVPAAASIKRQDGQIAAGLRAADNAGWVQRDGGWVFDPDGDGDDDSTPSGDTDHDYWSADGTQLKPIPPNPATGKGGKPMPQDHAGPGPQAASVDNSPWDAAKAWANGAAATDPAAFYGGICAGKKAGDPKTQAAHALPYRYHPGDPPNAAAVRNGLSRLPQTEGLTNETEAKALLERLMKEINPDWEPAGSTTAAMPSARKEPAMANDDGTLTIEGRRSRIGDIVARVQELARDYAASVMPPEIQAEWDTLLRERADHQAAVDQSDHRAAQLAAIGGGGTPGSLEMPQPAGNIPPGPNARQGPAVHIRQDDIYDVAAIRQRARTHDELPGLYRDNAMRAIEAARFPGSNREDAQAKVARLLDTIPDDTTGVLARRILNTGSPGYTRAFGLALRKGNPGALGSADARILALGESDTGEYAVPFQLDPTVLLTSDGTINPLRQISRVEQITGKEYDLVTSTGVTVSRKAEFAAETDNAPTLVQPTIKAERVSGFIPFSVEIEGDWTGLQASMMELLRDAKDVEEATAFTLGTGTPPDASGVVSTMDSGSNVDGTGGSGALGIDDPTTLESAMAPRFRNRASYLASKTTYNAYRKLFGAQAGYATDPWNRPSQGTPAQLWGYNAYEASDMAATHATADTPLLMGDFSTGFLIVDRVGMNMELVPHLFGSSQGQYPTGRRGYYAWWRNNSVVLIPNAFRLLVVQ